MTTRRGTRIGVYDLLESLGAGGLLPLEAVNSGLEQRRDLAEAQPRMLK